MARKYYWFALVLLCGVTLFAGVPFWPSPWLDNYRNPFLVLAVTAMILTTVSPPIKSLWHRYFDSPEDLLSEKSEHHIFGVLLAVHLFIYVKICLLNYFSFNVNAIDFSIFDFMIPNTARGHFMHSMTGMNHFGTHSTPILFLLYPFHRFFDHPLFFVVLHALVLWSAAIPFYLLVRLKVSVPLHRIIILISFFHFGFIGQILQYNFHIEVFYVPGFLWLFYFLDRRAYTSALVIAGFLLSVKEDAAVYLAAIALTLNFLKPTPPRFRFNLLAVSVAVFALNILWVIPHNAARSQFILPEAASAQGSISATILTLLSLWPQTLKFLVFGKCTALNVPFLFLPLLQPFIFWSSLPFVIIHATANAPVMRNLMLYYSAPYLPFVFFGFLLALSKDRLTPFRIAFSTRLKSIVLLVSLLFCTLVGGGYLQFKKPHPAYGSLVELRSQLDLQRSICIQGCLTPHFGYPPGYRLMTPECFNDNLEYYVVNPKLSAYPMAGEILEAAVNTLRKNSRYSELAYDDFLVFKKIHPPSSAP